MTTNKESIMHKPDNIKLEYPVLVQHQRTDGDSVYHAPKGAEFFMDEHGIQWVKFFPTNGIYRGKEHMLRTDQCIVIRDKDREREAAAHE